MYVNKSKYKYFNKKSKWQNITDINTSNANVRIPKPIFWKNSNLSDDWLLNNEIYQVNI